ncbi:hypothetical protein GCM10007063_28250 [Lentibacillus kapialis]|uniref:YtxH domain-containing protein n=1 Tax=Lentibacillus kapialis TaxID=340214 RepID=A0A917Q0U0_9BACI|nr:hypothetical protein [Lentibacillus kapialis]GGK04259.1 hypothetical protein GCM10007063_28250 [Lentibacillus kapialis]
MKKRFITAGAIAGGITGYLLRNEEKRTKFKSKVKDSAKKIKNFNQDEHSDSTLEDAGAPDQIESKDPSQLENSKMVSEGSQFGVDYYNKVKEKDD